MSETWDIICVGAGSAGLPLAIKAAERGAKILQIEADSRIGGTLYLSSGQISAAGTRLQKRHGIEDSPDAHFEDAQRITNGQIDPIVLRLFVDNAAATIDWLEDIGFEPAPGTPVAGEAHEAYNTRRYLWGGDKAVSILDALRPVHEKLVADGKIDLRLEHRLKSLVSDDSGSVTGVTVDTPNGEETFHGKNIVLACGGYAAGPELWNDLNPETPLCSHCNSYSRGDGIVAARELGATVDGQEKFLCTFAGWHEDANDPTSGEFLALSPKVRSIWEIFVDVNGKRFMKEDHQSIDYRERNLLKQPGMRMNIVFDEGIRQNAAPITLLEPDAFKDKFGSHPNFVKSDTIEGLAAELEVPADALQETIDEYNASVDAKVDAAWDKYFLIRKIENPPYYGIKAMGITVLSPAGLAVDDQLRVLKSDGSPIPNVYAAGEVMGFARTSGNAFVGALSLTPALAFGKILGERMLTW